MAIEVLPQVIAPPVVRVVQTVMEASLLLVSRLTSLAKTEVRLVRRITKKERKKKKKKKKKRKENNNSVAYFATTLIA